VGVVDYDASRAFNSSSDWSIVMVPERSCIAAFGFVVSTLCGLVDGPGLNGGWVGLADGFGIAFSWSSYLRDFAGGGIWSLALQLAGSVCVLMFEIRWVSTRCGREEVGLVYVHPSVDHATWCLLPLRWVRGSAASALGISISSAHAVFWTPSRFLFPCNSWDKLQQIEHKSFEVGCF